MKFVHPFKSLLIGSCAMLAGLAARAQVSSTGETMQPQIILRPTIPAYFQGCSHEPEGSDEKASCSAGKLMSYISRNVHYPDIAREQRVEGVVVLSFVITNTGKIEQVKILRDIGSGCGDEALRVLSAMPAWQAAIYKGQAVYTQFTLPITFGLKTNLFDYALHTGELPEGEVKRGDIIEMISSGDISVTSPKGVALPITELVYTFERGGARQQLISRGQELIEARQLEKFLGRKPGRLTIEANVADGLDIRTLTKNFLVVR